MARNEDVIITIGEDSTPTSGNAEGMKVLKLALDKIEKDYGKGSVINSSLKGEKVDSVSTGSLGLDSAIGVGGIPRGGKVTEIMGWESCGKSTIVLHVIANAQKAGLKCLLVDGEGSFDREYAKNLGVDVDDLFIVQLGAEGGEGCYNIAERLIRTGQIAIVAIDSQTSLKPKKEMEGEIGDSSIGLHARLMSQCVPKLMNAAQQNNCGLIFISQFREKIGVMFGNPETTNGGHALRFYAHVRIEVRKSVIKEDEIAVANKTKCKVIKNKLSVPFKTAEFRIDFGRGINRMKEIFDIAVEKDVIQKSGSWYSFGTDRIGQGEDNALQLFTDNPDFYAEVEKKVMEKL